MSRLRDANPDRVADIRNEQLRDLIVSHTPTWRPNDRAGEPALRRAWAPKISRLGGLRAGIAASTTAAAALAVALTVSLSGSAPNVAQAFPALNGPSVLTPAALALSRRNYGVAGDGGISIAKGHVVGTPWGNGYVLTGPGDSFVCVVAPGLSRADWGASCAPTKLATSNGTWLRVYAYDSATHTARLLRLLPQGATATMQTSGGPARRLSLSDGLLAVDITSPTQIAVTINGHTTVAQVSPQDATPAPPTSATSGPSATSTTVTETSTTVTGQHNPVMQR
jgi:hypothetical protein